MLNHAAPFFLAIALVPGFAQAQSPAAELTSPDRAIAATEPKHVAIRKQSVSSRQSLTIHLAPGGGCAIRFIQRH